MTDFSEIIHLLESEWDTDGFFERIRRGSYDAEQAQVILGVLRSTKMAEDELLPRRLVSLLWYIPSFLGWQVGRLAASGADVVAYERFTTEIHNALEELLGTP